MNKSAFFALLAILPGIAFAQLSSLPPSSRTDGIPVQPIGVNAGASHWESLSTLGAYRFASDGTLERPNMGSPDNVLGLSWAATAPAAFTDEWRQLNLSGGTMRIVFLGESASWRNDFGYTYSGLPQGPDAFTGFAGISAVAPGETIHFGDHLDISLAPGDPLHFDLWLNAEGTPGGVYTVIHPENSTPYVAPGNVLWSQSSLLVNTWIPATSDYQDIPAYLVGMEDWRLDQGSDRDSNDFLFAVQLFEKKGIPFNPDVDVSPVPEPSTYGAIAALTLIGAAAWRRRTRRLNLDQRS